MYTYIHICVYMYIYDYIYRYIYAGACMLSHFSHVQLFATLWTIACQDPLSVALSRQEYYSRLPCPSSPGNLPNPGIKPTSLISPELAAGSLPLALTREPIYWSL